MNKQIIIGQSQTSKKKSYHRTGRKPIIPVVSSVSFGGAFSGGRFSASTQLSLLAGYGENHLTIPKAKSFTVFRERR